MSIHEVMPQDLSFEHGAVQQLRVVKPLQLDHRTAQTDGLLRLAAISGNLAGSHAICAGVMFAEPGSTSAVHHHGSLETVVFALSGPSKIRWGQRLENEAELEPGDFLYVPPYMPHQEINPSHDQATQWIVARSGPEAIAVPLTKTADGSYVEMVDRDEDLNSDHAGGLDRAVQEATCH